MARNPIEYLRFGRLALQTDFATENWKKEHNISDMPESYREGLAEIIREYDEAILLLKKEKNAEK